MIIDLILKAYAVALPMVLSYIVMLLRKQKTVREANSNGTMLLLRDRLIDYHTKYTALGEIPTYAYETFIDMYEAYHDLGGNGMVTKMYEEIQELHLKRKKEA